MRYFVKSFEKENVTLTGYIHDVSNELKMLKSGRLS